MKIFVYLDESGSIHKNSKTKYFAVGGYISFEKNKNKIVSKYKKNNKIIKIENNYDLEKEVKSYEMTKKQKINIFKDIQEIDKFYGCVKVFVKSCMKKEIYESNIFFNYAVKLVFKDCIIPTIINIKETINFIVSVDNRNIRVGDLNNLENYLNTEFCLNNYNFKIKYYDSATNYGIQLADLIVNTFYNSYKDINIVNDVINNIQHKKFKISIFPKYRKLLN